MSDIKQKAREMFDERFPRFACDDDYCSPSVRTIGDNPEEVFDGEELYSGNEEVKMQLKSFIDEVIDLAIADYQTNFEQKHIVSALEVERKKIVEMVENSPKTFGLTDKCGRGGVILVEDVKELLNNTNK